MIGGHGGRTVGNMAASTVTSMGDRNDPGLRQGGSESAGAVRPGITIIGGILDILWPLWDKQNQTLHDKAAGTVVLRTNISAGSPDWRPARRMLAGRLCRGDGLETGGNTRPAERRAAATGSIGRARRRYVHAARLALGALGVELDPGGPERADSVPPPNQSPPRM